MAINPNIPLSVNPVQLPDQLGNMGRAMSIKGMMGNQRIQGLQASALEQKNSDRITMREALAQTNGDFNAAGDLLLSKGLYEPAVALKKAAAEQADAALTKKTKQRAFDETTTKGMSELAGVMLRARPDETQQVYQYVTDQWRKRGYPNAENFGPNFDPKAIPELRAIYQAGQSTAEAGDQVDMMGQGRNLQAPQQSGTVEQLLTGPVEPEINSFGLNDPTFADGEVQPFAADGYDPAGFDVPGQGISDLPESNLTPRQRVEQGVQRGGAIRREQFPSAGYETVQAAGQAGQAGQARQEQNLSPADAMRAEGERLLKTAETTIERDRAKFMLERADKMDARAYSKEDRMFKLEDRAIARQERAVKASDAAKKAADDQSKTDFDRADKLRDEFNAQSKEFIKVRDAYNRIGASAESPSAAGDLSMIFNYMKMLDPGSVVRESEFATAAQSGSYGARIQGMVQKALTGERLADSVRADFIDRANKLYKAALDGHVQLENEYGILADRASVNRKDILPNYRAGKANVKVGNVPTATNPETGEKVEYRDGKWQPIK